MFTTQTGTDILVAASFLQQGQCVGIPTETVYGLAANALNEDAVLNIFETKQRPKFDPLIVHTHNIESLKEFVEYIPEKAALLMKAYCPGPITFLLKKKDCIPDLVTAGLDTVAVRIPNHPVTLALLQQIDFPLAAPSANPFGYVSPTNAKHVHDQLHGKIPYILDGGAANIGVESTIVGFEKDEVIVYRLGGLAINLVEKITGSVSIKLNESSNPKSPGMLKSHYAPLKKLIYNSNKLITGKKTAVIAFDKYIDGYAKESQYLLSPSGDLQEAARNLFATMRKLDSSDAELIIAIQFPDEGLGAAINDRLKRAAANE